MWTRRPFGVWLLFTMMVIVIGSNYVLINLTVSTITPFSAAAGRALLALAALLPLMKMMGERPPAILEIDESVGELRLNRMWRYLLLVSSLAVALPFVLLAWAQQYVDASLTAIIVAVMPLTTVAVAPAIVATETWTLHKIIGFVLGFLGIAVLMGLDALNALGGDTVTIVAQLALLGAAICYGVAAVFVQRLGRVNPITAATIQNAVAGLLLLPFALILERPWSLSPSLSSVIALILMGIFATGFASMGFFLLVRLAGATFMSLTSYVSPLWAVLLAMVLLGERPGTNAFVALLLILAGLAFTEVRRGAFMNLLTRRV